ncbi:MAG: adenosylcobinamide-phosphate synthase CbiB [Pseudomonadota bacterium]
MTLALALILDALLGEPKWIWDRIPHPAVLIGRAIGWADATFNKGQNRTAKGVILLIALVLVSIIIGSAIADLGWWAEAIMAAILLAQRSLADHVRAVADSLRDSLAQGRRSVAMIVGRDTAEMDEPAVARAAIESAAENLSDGVIAPAFWFAIAGLPGMLAYKAVNTADSMIGYKTDRHGDFGWASARFDDLINWIPARLTALLILISHGALGLWPAVRREAPLHRSPNAGWPESALARSLGIALSGPRAYEGELRDFPFVNAPGRRDLGPADIDNAVSALWRAWAAALILVIAAGLLLL